MERISRQLMFMQMAEAASRRSTCFRRNVGAVIVVNNNIVSIGYNGPPSGEPHCTGKDCVPPGMIGCQRSVHAEHNAIERWVKPELTWRRWLFTKIFGSSLPAQLYATESPCNECCNLIANCEFNAIYYLNEYRDTSGLRSLPERIKVIRMTPSGYMIDFRTGELLT